jgi:hypothetical protein
LTANIFSAFNAALTLLLIYLLAISSSTKPFAAGYVSIDRIKMFVQKAMSAIDHLRPGSAITLRCRLYLDELLKKIEAIEASEQQYSAPMVPEQAPNMRLGNGALAPASQTGVGQTGVESFGIDWENFLLDPGQLDDFVLGM